MAVLQMQKIHICALNTDRKQILESLQRKGIVQINADQDTDIFHCTDTSAGCAKYEKFSHMADQALKILDTYAPEKKGLLASFEGKREVGLADYRVMEKNRGEAIEKADRIGKLSRTIAEQKANLTRTQVQYDQLMPWLGLDVPMNYAGTSTTRAFIGTLPAEYSLEQVTQMLANAAPELDAFSVEIISADTDQTCIFAVCPTDQAEQLDDALRQCGFSRPSVHTSSTPEAYADQLSSQMDEIREQIDKAEADLEKMGEHRRTLELMRDYYKTRAEKYAVLGGLQQSRHTFFLNGYVPEKYAADLSAELQSSYDCVVELEDVPEDEEAPVLLQNNVWCARNVHFDGDVIVYSGTFIAEGTTLRRTVICGNTYIGTKLDLDGKIVVGNRIIDAETGVWTDVEDEGIARRIHRTSALGWLRALWSFLLGRSRGRRY